MAMSRTGNGERGEYCKKHRQWGEGPAFCGGTVSSAPWTGESQAKIQLCPDSGLLDLVSNLLVHQAPLTSAVSGTTPGP